MTTRSLWLWCAVLCAGGCSSWNALSVRSQSPDSAEPAESKVRMIRDLAVPFNMYPVRVEAVGLLTGLHGTGSDPVPSPQRAALIDEMQTRGVTNPNRVLASRDCSLVLLQGVLRPGIQKGDHFDVEVRVPAQNETTSLRGGYLLEARLKEMAVLNNQFHEGNLLGLAKGPVMVDPSADARNDRVMQCRGIIPGGGTCLKSRPLGLVLRPKHQTVFNAARIANAVNKRFFSFEKGIQVGVAKAETDKYIELKVHPRYKNNIERYVQVVRAVAIRESAPERMGRIRQLKEQLLDPATAADAAVQLEAIGGEGVEALGRGTESKEPEVRFYAAEALAYLDRPEAAEPLGEMARTQPAFRVFALLALSVMDDFAAHEQLRNLLEVPSAETRYGAFRALWTMDSRDPLVMGEPLAEGFSYHVLGTNGPEMIHVSRNRRPEVVVFGQHQRLKSPVAVNAGNQIMATSYGADEIAVSKFTPGEPDQKRVVSTRVDDVIRAIAELGGSYPDVVQALQEAKAAGALPSRFEVDALPEPGRKYQRLAGETNDQRSARGEKAAGDATTANIDASQAVSPSAGETKAEGPAAGESPNAPQHRTKGLFARILGRHAEQ